MIDTILGLMEEKDLVCETVAFDGPDYYAFERQYRVAGQGEVVARYHDVKWQKKNDFLESPAVVLTSRGEMSLEKLEKKTGVNDDAREYSCWVEYRPVGEEEIVHRSAHTRLKVVPPPVLCTPGHF